MKRKTRQKWIEAACAGGNAEAYYDLHGVELGQLHESAEAGVVRAQVALGIYYATLRDPDLAKSRSWYLQAALQGDGCAMYEIGFTLLLGEGGPPDTVQGIEWLEKAAFVETWYTEDARRLLGDIYHDGLFGVAQDLERSKYWRSLLS
ncbi:MAG: sel1 repeat family protein [Candidatus Eremiobacteraeota bacterium]|nr:sel1 repeat family protein [Candidatus Eremiobacteraeota bacterium]